MDFKTKVKNRELSVAVIGLGYVGLPLAVEFAKENFKVIGIDIDADKVSKINAGENYISDVKDEELKSAVERGLISATTDFSKISKTALVSICVPTPLNKLKDPDMSYISNSLKEIKKHIQKDMIIILESTTYPGTTREFMLPILEESGLKAGEDFYLAFSPERVDPGNPTWHTKNTPKVLGGVSAACTEHAKIFYDEVFDKVVSVSSTEAAELTKLLENTFRMINIGLVNELAMICDRLGVNVWEVIDAAGTKPFGFMKFFPGPGLGGHCIPIDPHYLSWKMKSLNYKTQFIDLAAEINTSMPEYVVDTLTDGLNLHKKSINGSKIMILGMAYKKDIDDLRESPSLDIFSILQAKGAEVCFHDPFCSTFKDENGTTVKSKELTIDEIKSKDALIIATDHSTMDYELIIEHAALVVDSRNATKDFGDRENIIRLGHKRKV